MKKILIGLVMILLIGSVLALGATQIVTVTVLPGKITLYSPEEGTIYDTRRIPFNISLTGEVEEIEYSDNGERWKTLCRDCDEYGLLRRKTRTLRDGDHNLSIRATFGTFEMNTSVNFFIDSKEPDLGKVEPRRGFVNGSFYLEFDEDNPRNLTFFYGNDSREINISESCVEGRREWGCDFVINLSKYDQQEIETWAALEDIAGSVDESRKRVVSVDFENPILNNPDSFWNNEEGSKYVYFNLSITEENLDEVVYTYLDSRGQLRDRRLCSRLKEGGICYKKKSFSRGEHNITIKILDQAGNSAEFPINFVVDY